jgi:hypothetical protein
MVTYSGHRTIDGIMVARDGVPLDQRLDVAQWSSAGFEWGFEGAPSNQLAFALLADHLGDVDRARAIAPMFAVLIVSRFDNDWQLTSQDVAEALSAIQALRSRDPT